MAASEAGAVFYLVKPPDLHQLDRAIIVAVTGFNHKRELIRLNEQLANEINRRNAAEQMAMAGEIRYRDLFELLRDGVVLLDLKGVVVQYNSSFLKMVGYFSNELDGVAFENMLFVDDLPVYKKIYKEQLMTRGWSDNFEIRFRCKSGELLTIEMRAWLRYDTPQNPSGLWVYLHDITERKKSELLLRQSERKFRAFTENTPDVIIRLDCHGKILYVNPAFEKMTGVHDEFAIGKKVDELENIELDFNLDKQSTFERLKAGEIIQTDIFLKSPAGKFVFNCRILAEFDDNGEFQSVLSTSRDITELKQIQQNLLQFEKMRAVDQLAGGIAHDFNNQLSAIMGYSDMLLGAVAHDKKLTKYTEAIVSATRRATDLTAKLLTFSRKGKMKTVVIDLHEIIHEVVILLQHSIDKNISIETDLQAENSCISGDPSQVQNALLNLSLNARDAMESGGTLTFETADVSIDEQYCGSHNIHLPNGSYISISVRDTGCGMDAEVQKHLFEPFFTTKEEGKGTGMGLAAVYGIVKSHKGNIIVQSTPGNGATFRLLLPQTSKVGHPNTRTIKTIRDFSGISVLIIDDEEAVAKTIKDMLTGFGFTVTTCYSGREAVEIYRMNWKTINIIIIDMVMPDFDGRETFFKMREINPNLSTIISSGFALTKEIELMLKAGANTFLQKPYNQQELVGQIEKILAKKDLLNIDELSEKR